MHSIPQIILGSLLGIFLAYGLNGVIRFFIWNRIVDFLTGKIVFLSDINNK
jgi:hypothetical protein